MRACSGLAGDAVSARADIPEDYSPPQPLLHHVTDRGRKEQVEKRPQIGRLFLVDYAKMY